MPESHEHHSSKVLIYSKLAELVKEQYQKFFNVVDQNQHSFSSFDPANDRVDCLLSKTMGSSKLYENLWEFSKMVLILYHGQSSVERGFSVNKQFLVENLKT